MIRNPTFIPGGSARCLSITSVHSEMAFFGSYRTGLRGYVQLVGVLETSATWELPIRAHDAATTQRSPLWNDRRAQVDVRVAISCNTPDPAQIVFRVLAKQLVGGVHFPCLALLVRLRQVIVRCRQRYILANSPFGAMWSPTQRTLAYCEGHAHR